MSTVPTQVLCRQCSAPLPVEQGVQYFTCQFCGTTNFVDKGRAVFHYAVRTTLRENDAEAALRRWMGGNQTVKELDRKAQIERPVFQLFPMWLVRVTQNGQEMVLLEPAAALSISEFKQMSVPAGDLEPYDHTLDSTATEVTVPYERMVQWLQEDRKIPGQQIREVSLVHLPVYQFKYSFSGRRYTALVDAATSKVFANIYPSKWETPYLAIGGAAFLAYFCAALIPIASYAVGDATGLGIGVLAYLVIIIVIGIPIFAAAVTISARV